MTVYVSTVSGSSAERCAPHAATCRPTGSAIHRRFVDRGGVVLALAPVSRRWLSTCDASLPSGGSCRAQFPTVSSTTKALRLPASHPWALIGFAPRVPHLPPPSLPRRGRTPRGPGPLFRRWSLSGWHRVDDTGSPRFPGDPSCAFAHFQDPGRTGDTSPSSAVSRCCPRLRRLRRLRRLAISGLTTGLRHALSTLQEHPCGYPGKTRFRLVGSNLYRAGFDPAESLRKVSDHMIFLLSRAYPGATSPRSG